MFLQETDLNVVPGGIIPVMHVSQYDVGRELKFVLYSGYDYASLESGTTVTIEGTKPDGHGFQYSGVLDQNAHTATFVTTEQMTVKAGAIECKLTLYLNSQRIGTALFILDVEKAGINDSTIISDTELPLIIAQATEQMERAESAATAAALSEENAEAEALKAEGYATGKQNGEDVSSESPYYHNNAEYYSEYAESIAESLPDGLNIKGTCTFAELPSIADSFVGDTWVISDSFTTTSDFRGGSGVSVAAGAYVYLTDSNKWDILPSKSSGHTILDEDGITYPQRSKLKFEGAIVSDDETNDATVVETVNPVENLVDNPWFTINQREFVGESTGTWQYTVDRWVGEKGVSYDGGIITIKKIEGSNSNFYQYREATDIDEFVGKTFTLSVMLSDGTIKTLTGVFKDKATLITGSGWKNALVGDPSLSLGNNIFAQIVCYSNGTSITRMQAPVIRMSGAANGTTISLRAVKLERGLTSSLSMDTIPNYQQELAKCQRYFYRHNFLHISSNGIGSGYSNDASNLFIQMPLPVTMRATPTITMNGDIYVYGEAKRSAPTSYTASINRLNSSSVKINLTLSGVTLTPYNIYYVEMKDTTGVLDLSADL